jgi:hypothetical protein
LENKKTILRNQTVPEKSLDRPFKKIFFCVNWISKIAATAGELNIILYWESILKYFIF